MEKRKHDLDMLIKKCVQQVNEETALAKMWQFIESCGTKSIDVDKKDLLRGVDLVQPSGQRCHLILIPSHKIVKISMEGSTHDIIYDFGTPNYVFNELSGSFSSQGVDIRVQRVDEKGKFLIDKGGF